MCRLDNPRINPNPGLDFTRQHWFVTSSFTHAGITQAFMFVSVWLIPVDCRSTAGGSNVLQQLKSSRRRRNKLLLKKKLQSIKIKLCKCFIECSRHCFLSLSRAVCSVFWWELLTVKRKCVCSPWKCNSVHLTYCMWSARMSARRQI